MRALRAALGVASNGRPTASETALIAVRASNSGPHVGERGCARRETDRYRLPRTHPACHPHPTCGPELLARPNSRRCREAHTQEGGLALSYIYVHMNTD